MNRRRVGLTWSSNEAARGQPLKPALDAAGSWARPDASPEGPGQVAYRRMTGDRSYVAAD